MSLECTPGPSTVLTSEEEEQLFSYLIKVSDVGFGLSQNDVMRIAFRIAESSGALAGTTFRCSDSGWVNGELFMDWFKLFTKMIPPARPILLILDGHASHISVEVIEYTQKNQIHMLCLPAHTTHLLQPLDVGVFKSLKSFYYKACKEYTTDHPGRVITTDVIASLLADAWPQSITPVNIMSGYKKSGTYLLNPGEIKDRDIALSKSQMTSNTSPVPGTNDADSKSQSTSNTSPLSGTENLLENLDLLHQKHYEEGYDIYDEKYVSWLCTNHPEAILPKAPSGPASSSIPTDSSSNGLPSTAAKSEASSSLSEILALPEPKARVGKQRKKREV